MKIEKIIEKIRNNEISEGMVFDVEDYGNYRWNGFTFVDCYYGEDIVNDIDFGNLISSEWSFHDFKVNNLELRGTNLNLSQSCSFAEADTLEIVKWINSQSCITIAYWKEDQMGFNLCMVSDRVFEEDIDIDEFWDLAESGQYIAQGIYKRLVNKNIDYIKKLRGEEND